LGLRIVRTIEMKVEVTSDERLVGSAVLAARDRKVSRSVRKSEKGTDLRGLMVAGGGR
jgi:hypothetical protein